MYSSNATCDRVITWHLPYWEGCITPGGGQREHLVLGEKGLILTPGVEWQGKAPAGGRHQLMPIVHQGKVYNGSKMVHQATRFRWYADFLQEDSDATMLENDRRSLQSLLGDALWAPCAARIKGWATQTWSSKRITTIIEGRFKIGPNGASAATLYLLGYSPEAHVGLRFEVLSSICTLLSAPSDPALRL